MIGSFEFFNHEYGSIKGGRSRAKELLSQEVRNDWFKSPETLEREGVLSLGDVPGRVQ